MRIVYYTGCGCVRGVAVRGRALEGGGWNERCMLMELAKGEEGMSRGNCCILKKTTARIEVETRED